ncbi:MAG TPA: hypothetical protein VLK57_13125, partial [Pseudonocardia sp.]|nr:hypothetical protein [Pseudonocardia sp.]
MLDGFCPPHNGADEFWGIAMEDGTRSVRLWHSLLTLLAATLTALATAPTAAASAPPGLTAEAAVGIGGVDVFATSTSSALQVDGQDGRFPATPMRHDGDSTRFYARLPISPGRSVTSVTVRDTQADPPTTVSVDVQAISIIQATYDGTTLTIAAAADATRYPLTVDAGGAVGILPSPAPVGFPLSAPPRTITVSSGALRAVAPVTITDRTASTAVAAAAPPTATVAAATLSAPRGVATAIDGSGSTNATTFKAVIKNGPQGATLVDDSTSRPSILLPTWAAPTDVLPRVAAALTPTVVTFTATNGTASSTVDVTVNPVGDTVAVSTARSRAGAELQVAGTSTISGMDPTLA